VNYQDDRYTTALHTACRVQQTAMAQFLIERGADVNAVAGFSLNFNRPAN